LKRRLVGNNLRPAMPDEGPARERGEAEELLRRALLDDSSAAAVSLRVEGLPVTETVTVIFHGRRDLGTLQTYVAYGSKGAGATVAARSTTPFSCRLDCRRPVSCPPPWSPPTAS